MSAFNKAHTSALCLIPPRRAWAAIQDVRCFNDRNFIRWPPHINLIYPFVADQKDSLEKAANIVSTSIASTEAFEITLDEVNFFEHSQSCTIWLGGQSPRLLELQKALQEAFPDFHELSKDPQRNIREFRPHLSLGQWKQDNVQESLQEIRRNFEPITFPVSSLEIISREGASQPFKVRYSVPLNGRKARQVNVPYVATVGPETSTESENAKMYGMGGEQEGVYYFAYGANMSPKKLTGSRNITPLDSRPAMLPGWALEFNHRGAMGNIVKLSNGAHGSGGFTSAFGVAHRLQANDFALLTAMEHEYRPTEVILEDCENQQTFKAVAFVSPEDRLIQYGLPPTERYANLLRGGADEFKLNPDFRNWLHSIPTVPSEGKRGDEYWRGLTGEPLKMYPRIWSGTDKKSGRGRSGGRGRGRGGGRRGGRGGGRDRASRVTERQN